MSKPVQLYKICRSDGIPLTQFNMAKVYRGETFVHTSQPQVNDLISIDNGHEVVNYVVRQVVNGYAFTDIISKVPSKRPSRIVRDMF